MQYLLLLLLTILLVALCRSRYFLVAGSFIVAYIHLLLELICPLSTLTYSLLWMVSPTLSTFLLGKSFKSQLWPIFIFHLIAAGIMILLVWNVQGYLFYYAGANYLIQLVILIKNAKMKWTVEQGLFGIFCLGGIGSLIFAIIFGYPTVEICLVFYYCMLILCSIFGNSINRFRERNF